MLISSHSNAKTPARTEPEAGVFGGPKSPGIALTEERLARETFFFHQFAEAA